MKTYGAKVIESFFARVFNHNFKIGTVNSDVALYRRHNMQMHQSKKKAKVNEELQKSVLKLIKKKTDISGLKLLE